jgi:cyclohexanone monooxygenase
MSQQRHSIVIVGAGPSGICTAIKLREAGIDDFVLLERSSAPGGTWQNNRYPGLACDVPSHLYSFTFEQKPDWRREFSYQPEIRAYMQEIVAKHGLGRSIRLNAEVREARWDDGACEWTFMLGDGSTVIGDVFVSALGMFNEIVWPDIEGLSSFAGEMLHTASWPEGKSLAGKRVAVIGTAASATQMIPVIASEVSQLYVYQRTANWVFPKPDKDYSEAELAEARENPAVGLAVREKYRDVYERLVLFDDQALMAQWTKGARELLAQVQDPETRRKLEPQVPAGSQRPLLSNEFYPTFNRPNVELVTEPIERITPRGVVTNDGKLREIDVLVLATGYAAYKFLSVIEVSGRGGLRLADAWKDGAIAYRGITTAGFPNLFMLYGPNTNNGSILFMIERQADYIVRKIRLLRDERLAWIEVRGEAMAAYNAWLQAEMAKVEAWRTVGSHYYRAASGRIVTQWPGNMAKFAEMTSAEDTGDYELGPREEPLRARA